MISFNLAPCGEIYFFRVEGQDRRPMICAVRSAFARRAIPFLFVLLGTPSLSHSASLEDSAKELGRKIATALPAQMTVSCEVRNISSLRPDEVARIEQALKTELQDLGIGVSAPSDSSTNVIVSLSENWKEFVWTGEIHEPDATSAVSAVLLAVPRDGETHSSSNPMHVTLRTEKFWEGGERILDAAQVSGGSGKSWLVLLLPAALSILDLQTGSTRKVDFADLGLEQLYSRDPRGQVDAGPASSTIWFAVSSHTCKIDLDALTTPECASKGEPDVSTSGGSSLMMDLAPAGPPPPGKGIELVIAPVCGAANQFLATSARDYTQTDSVQVFQTEPNGPVAVSGESDFAGPILALHAGLDAPRAIVRNLSTGNYEAYRLAISCGE
jgi:hypothetical protein